jgi:hypothetical protein
MSQIRKFIEWMSFHPSTEEIARALATDYLADYAIQGIRFGRINSDDSIMVLGQYGYPDADAWRNRVIPSAEWRAVDSPDVQLIANASKEKWTPNSLMHVNSLRDHGVIQGYLIVEFSNPVSDSDKQKIAEAIDDLCVPIALYLSFQSRGISTNTPGITTINDSRDSGAGQLSARQLSISARYGGGQDQPRASHRNGLFSLNDPPRDYAYLPGARGQRSQGSCQESVDALSDLKDLLDPAV